ncbi:MAG: penicillin-binding transpeptidase domain-containing protein [Defluviitaleaceae bacterium]|nr:penicillin-binding transpeptidase domain-containing protein [Defluviitaleaceae bacterium]
MIEKEKPLQRILGILNNRLIVLLIMSIMAFLFLSSVLFDLQIVQGQLYYEGLTSHQLREISLPAERGNIYDRFGRPLAVNSTTRSVMFDPSINLTAYEVNTTFLNLLVLLESNGEEFMDTLPITPTPPFEFTFSGENPRGQRARFFRDLEVIPDTRTYTESGAVDDPGLLAPYLLARLTVFFSIDQLLYDIPTPGNTAQHRRTQMINYLESFFTIGDIAGRHPLTPTQVRNIISLRTNLFNNHRGQLFVPMTIALDVSLETITNVEEDPQSYRSTFISTGFLRHYPAGRYFSHIVGYIDRFIESDNIEHLLSIGYELTDLIGRTGIESAFEDYLRGTRGREQIYVNNVGRRMGTVANSRVDPIGGSDIFLTLDKYLQIEAFHILQNTLARTIIARMTTDHHNEGTLEVEAVLASLVAANNLDPRPIFESEPGSVSHQIMSYVLSVDETVNATMMAGRVVINRIISNAITDGRITPGQILAAMYEQGIILDDGYPFFAHRVANSSNEVARNIVVSRLENGEITPQMTNVDPSTGSLVLVDVHTGEVLASVSYPSFDTNQLVNNFNNAYWISLMNDPTTPLINRPFWERRPPGSVFKMITGIAALEYGVITTYEQIVDQVVFTRAGEPNPTSWASVSLGNINIAEAIAISSNYFFYESSFRLGDTQTGHSPLLAIDRLNTYMEAFGLDTATGVEIGETYRHAAPNQMASPGLQEFFASIQGTTNPWTPGDTVRVAIGQQLNDYTAAAMARLTAGLATRGNVVNLRLLDRIAHPNGVYIARTIPFSTDIPPISESTWDAIHEGMRLVTEAAPGRATASGLFSHFPFSVGSKTGTAEHDQDHRLSHTTFNAFAPLHDPQIAIYVVIPFGATGTISPSASSQVARDVIGAYFQLNTVSQIVEEDDDTSNTNVLLMR